MERDTINMWNIAIADRGLNVLPDSENMVDTWTEFALDQNWKSVEREKFEPCIAIRLRIFLDDICSVPIRPVLDGQTFIYVSQYITHNALTRPMTLRKWARANKTAC